MILLDIKKKIYKEKKEKIEFIDLNESDDNENDNKSNNHSDSMCKNKNFSPTNFSSHKHSRYLDNI